MTNKGCCCYYYY